MHCQRFVWCAAAVLQAGRWKCVLIYVWEKAISWWLEIRKVALWLFAFFRDVFLKSISHHWQDMNTGDISELETIDSDILEAKKKRSSKHLSNIQERLKGLLRMNGSLVVTAVTILKIWYLGSHTCTSKKAQSLRMNLSRLHRQRFLLSRSESQQCQ